jgi:hypothetical protein
MQGIYRMGGKRSPASPAGRNHLHPNKVSRPQSIAHGAPDRSRSATRRRGDPQTLLPDQRRPPADPVTLGRLRHLLAVVGPAIGNEFSANWLAHAMSRFDGGPVLDPPRLGPCLRQFGFVPLRSRRGGRRISVWLLPGVPRPRRGRPPTMATSGTSGKTAAHKLHRESPASRADRPGQTKIDTRMHRADQLDQDEALVCAFSENPICSQPSCRCTKSLQFSRAIPQRARTAGAYRRTIVA